MRLIDKDTFARKRVRKTFEPGHRSFISDEEALNWDPIFLEEEQVEGGYRYKKTTSPITLPISCIEAATWSINCMKSHERLQYPGYMEFSDEMYDFDARYYDDVLRIFSPLEEEPDQQQILEVHEILRDAGISEERNAFLQRYSKFLYRKTFVEAIGDAGSIRNLDTQNLDDRILDARAYSGSYEVGDGILIAAPGEGGLADFHAVAIVAVFQDGGMIVVERNAGSTEIAEGHIGDRNWLLNYYSDAAAFLEVAEEETSGYKIYKLAVT